ncbi:MAG: DUF2490 domain-containing protein [Alistipes sp.]
MKQFGYLGFLLGLLGGLLLSDGAQAQDLQAYTGLSVEKTIAHRLHLAWSEELHMKERITQVDRIYSIFGLSYDLRPWLEVGVNYTFIAVKKRSDWEFRNRANFDLTGSYHIASQWKLSLRERLRVTSTNKETDAQITANPAWILRSRLQVEHKLRRAPLTPYGYVELSNTLNAPAATGDYIDKIRFSLGVKYAVTTRSTLNFYYRLDHNYTRMVEQATWIATSERQNNHIIGIFYEYSF